MIGNFLKIKDGKLHSIYVFGNPLLSFDSLPLKLVPRLRKIFPEINFVVVDPNENLKPVNKKLFIIDTVEGIDQVMVLDSLERITLSKTCSLHDFDLGFNLKLLQKIGELEKAIIIGVPMKNKKETFPELVREIRKLKKKMKKAKQNN